jgi:cytochrome c-type biogenesis protein CcmH/NrfG
MMKMRKQLIWTLVGGTALVAVSFSLGYTFGSKSQRSPVETKNRLISDDIEHAFGSVKSSAHESAMQEPAVMGLSGLVAGLEKKVAANPANIDQQLLLAQTYNELNNRAQSLKLLHILNKQSPGNAQVKITLATILMTGADKQELKEAYQMFDEAIKLKPEVASMARMYQGEIRVELDNLNKQ